MYALQHIADLSYAFFTGRYVTSTSMLSLIDLTIFAIYLSNILITYSRDLLGTWADKPALSFDDRAWIYAMNYSGGLVNENAVWICCIIVMWVRVLYLIRFNEDMGKFLSVIERLLYDVLLFFIAYVVELVFFSLMA